MANEKLGLATEPSPKSLWGGFTFVKWGGFIKGGFTFVQWG